MNLNTERTEVITLMFAEGFYRPYLVERGTTECTVEEVFMDKTVLCKYVTSHLLHDHHTEYSDTTTRLFTLERITPHGGPVKRLQQDKRN